jgi:TrmH family RNA methyltransferase
MPVHITSLANPRIKSVLRLAKAAERAARRLTVVEGIRECALALDVGIVPVEAYVCPARQDDEARPVAQRLYDLDAARKTTLAEVSPEVFDRLTYRGASGGILLVIPYLAHRLDDLDPPDPALLVVVEGVEKPGNLGAILRTADAAGVHAVIVADGATDLHNPNVIRASLGAVFTLPVVEAPTGDVLAWLHARGIAIVAATPDARTSYFDADLTVPLAIVLGAEAHGLSLVWAGRTWATVAIPMAGHVDSLNLATSAALLVYEAIRQRSAKRASQHPVNAG